MTLKQKLKQALFNFFKDEIIKVVGEEKIITYTHEYMGLVEIKSRVLVKQNSGMRPIQAYERAMKSGAMEILDQLGEYVQVSEIETIENKYENKLFELSLFVGIKK